MPSASVNIIGFVDDEWFERGLPDLKVKQVGKLTEFETDLFKIDNRSMYSDTSLPLATLEQLVLACWSLLPDGLLNQLRH